MLNTEQEEKFEIIEGVETFINENNLCSELNGDRHAALGLRIDKRDELELAVSNPYSMFSTNVVETGIQSIKVEQESGITGIDLSTNSFEDACSIGTNFSNKTGLLGTTAIATREINLEAAKTELGDSYMLGALENPMLGQSKIGLSSSLELDKSIDASMNAFANTVSLGEDVFVGPGFGLTDEKSQLLATNASVENIFSGISVVKEESFLGNTGTSFIDAGIGFFPDEDELFQVVNDALEEFGKSLKLEDSEISVKSFIKTYQSNSSYGPNTSIAVVNFFNFPGDFKHSNICITENNNIQ